jgi:hypothetical protein
VVKVDQTADWDCIAVTTHRALACRPPSALGSWQVSIAWMAV